MKFESEKELREFVLSRGCFDKAENVRIHQKYFRVGLQHFERLRHSFDFADKMVLVVGCSYGQHLIHFPQGSTGIEIQPRMVEFAKSLGLQVLSANVEDYIPVDNSSFDVIHCNDVLEHMIAPHKLLREFHRVLRSNGKVVIGVPNMDSLFGSGGWKGSEHLYAYNKKSMQFLLERAGFKVLKIVVVGRRLPKIINCLARECLLPKFGAEFYTIAEKNPDFSYSERRLEIFSPSWMKR